LPDLIESIESRSITSSGGQASATRIFHLSGESSVKNVINNILAGSTIGSVTMPKQGDKFPELPGLRVVDYSVALVADQTDLWRIEFTYQQNGAAPTVDGGTIGDLNGRLSGQKGHVEITSEIRSEFVPAYRGGITFYPAFGNINTTNFEVGGYPIDAAGQPTSVQRDIGEVTVSEVMSFEESQALQSTIRDFRFRRNSNGRFLGVHGKGTVLYKGASIRRVSESFVQVVHSFAVDRAYHLQQKVSLDQDGEPYLNANYQAAYVYWVQPFQFTADLSQLSPNKNF
jgi:hypothetical protein